MEIKVKKVFRASKIAGIAVRNPENDDIGEIKDVVIDLKDGDVAYAVLSFSTWFSEKLFAVPWKELSFTHDEETHYFVLDTTEERLKSAPGFDPDNWPDVASDDWREEIETHYNDES